MKYQLTILLLSIYGIIYAQSDDIKTDRPDQTETASIVPAGRFQMENGFTYQKSEKDREYIFPTSLLKFGLANRIELRVIEEFEYMESEDVTGSGLKPLIIGAKYNLISEAGCVPEISLITQVELPKVASSVFKARYIAPELRLLFDHSIGSQAEVGSNVGLQWDDEDGLPIYEYTISPNIDISEKLAAYIEEFAFLKANTHGQHWIDGGFIFLATKNLQFDISAGYEITKVNHHTHQYFQSVGMSFRI